MAKSKKSKDSVSQSWLDEETLRRLRSRDAEFLASLFSDVNPYLLRICAASGVHKEHAEEVIFNTWERFFSNLDSFEGRSQIRTFICGILFNKIREYRRDAQRVSYEEDSESFLNDAFTAEGWWKNPPHDPHRLLAMKQSGVHIQDCIEGLTDQQKTAFIMREVEEETAESICGALGVSTANLRVLIFRAKEKLRQCLEGKADGWEDA